MTQDRRLTLSALLDNEADDLELRRLLRDFEQLPPEQRAEMEATWSRYHLVQSVLHEQGVPVSADFSARLQASLDDEEIYHGATRTGVTWPRQLARLAIAASVAVIVVLGMQTSLQPQAPLPVATTAPDTSTGPDAQADSEALLADNSSEADAESAGLVYDYIRSIVIDPSEPAGFEHIEDSPLYRLVNQLQDQD